MTPDAEQAAGTDAPRVATVAELRRLHVVVGSSTVVHHPSCGHVRRAARLGRIVKLGDDPRYYAGELRAGECCRPVVPQPYAPESAEGWRWVGIRSAAWSARQKAGVKYRRADHGRRRDSEPVAPGGGTARPTRPTPRPTTARPGRRAPAVQLWPLEAADSGERRERRARLDIAQKANDHPT